MEKVMYATKYVNNIYVSYPPHTDAVPNYLPGLDPASNTSPHSAEGSRAPSGGTG